MSVAWQSTDESSKTATDEKAQNVADIANEIYGLDKSQSPQTNTDERAQNVADTASEIYEKLYGTIEFLLNVGSEVLPIGLVGAGVTAATGLLQLEFPKIPGVGFGGT